MSWTDLQSSTSSLAGIFASGGLSIPVVLPSGMCARGIRTALKRQDVNSDMGLISGKYEFSVLFRAEDVEGRVIEPRRDKVVIDAKAYRVLGVQRDSVNATVRIDLGDVLA